jgi:hypothetical protein
MFNLSLHRADPSSRVALPSVCLYVCISNVNNYKNNPVGTATYHTVHLLPLSPHIRQPLSPHSSSLSLPASHPSLSLSLYARSKHDPETAL